MKMKPFFKLAKSNALLHPQTILFPPTLKQQMPLQNFATVKRLSDLIRCHDNDEIISVNNQKNCL